MDDAARPDAPLPTEFAPPPIEIPTLGAVIRATLAAPGFREDLRFFLTAYVVAFALFLTWLA